MSNERIVRVSAHAGGAEVAAVSGPEAVFAAPATWRVTSPHLPRPRPGLTYRVDGPDRSVWLSRTATPDGDAIVLVCDRADGPGGLT